MEPPPLSRILEHVKIRTENKEMEVLDIRSTITLTLNKKIKQHFWIDISVISDLNQMTFCNGFNRRRAFTFEIFSSFLKLLS